RRPGRPDIGPRRASLGRPGLLQAELLHHAVAHDELLRLARDGHRQLGHEAHVARDLVVRDLVAAEVADLLLGRRHAGLEDDPRADLFAILGVGHAEDLHRLHLRMPEQELLDLARIHVLAPADEHVLHAADDVAVALGVDRREVARVHPAVDHDLARALLVVPVPQHHRVAPGAELALLAHGHDAALGVDDAP